jgi:hypothetical protein
MKYNSKFNNNGIILVNTFSREIEVLKCLTHLLEANLRLKLPVVIVHQIGHNKVREVISQFRSSIDYLIEIDGKNLTPLENINRNRILGYQIGFDWLQADWVLAVEEDVLVSPDTLSFITKMMNIYFNKLFFRGINLGSREPRSSENFKTYSRLRYGLHGQASAITSKTWRHFNCQKLLQKSGTHPFDSQVENYLKHGFMVTPNNSRYLDNGWNGTHAPKNPDDKYYRELAASWVNFTPLAEDEYIFKNINHSWRQDVKVFCWYTTPWHTLRRAKARIRLEVLKILRP